MAGFFQASLMYIWCSRIIFRAGSVWGRSDRRLQHVACICQHLPRLQHCVQCAYLVDHQVWVGKSLLDGFGIDGASGLARIRTSVCPGPQGKLNSIDQTALLNQYVNGCIPNNIGHPMAA